MEYERRTFYKLGGVIMEIDNKYITELLDDVVKTHNNFFIKRKPNIIETTVFLFAMERMLKEDFKALQESQGKEEGFELLKERVKNDINEYLDETLFQEIIKIDEGEKNGKNN